MSKHESDEYVQGVIFGAQKVTELYVNTLDKMYSDKQLLKIMPELPTIIDALKTQAVEAAEFAVNTAAGLMLMDEGGTKTYN